MPKFLNSRELNPWQRSELQSPLGPCPRVKNQPPSIAPVFRSKLPESERLSVPTLVRDLYDRGQMAREADSIDDIIGAIVKEHRSGDIVVIMSNGGFSGIHHKLLRALS